MTRHFCTYFDINFLNKGLALYESLLNTSDDFQFYILGLDQETVTYFHNNPYHNIIVVGLNDITHLVNPKESYDDTKQFYFSLTPALCLYILDKFKPDKFWYLDADIYFFNSYEFLYDTVEDASIGITRHNLTPFYKLISNHPGTFNVGINYFKNDSNARKCIEHWIYCINNWRTIPNYPLNYLSDQIFLDNWPAKFNRVKVITHKGINAALWNIKNYKISEKDGNYFLDNDALIAFHFSSLNKISDRTWHSASSKYLVNMKGLLVDIYIKYIIRLEELSNITKITLTSKVSFTYKNSRLRSLVQKKIEDMYNQIIKF